MTESIESPAYNIGVMSLRLLRTLVAVADEKTFSRAAVSVNVTHAAVSQQMKALEAELGMQLFDRSTRTPRLTPAGHQVVARARGLIADYDTLVPSVADDGGLSGMLALGAMPTTLTGLAPRALAVLKTAHPHIGLHISPGLTRGLMTAVARNALDAAIISKPQSLPSGLMFRPLADETMHLIAAPDEPQDDPHALLQTRPFIRFNRDAVVGTLIDNWLTARRFRVQDTMELDSPEAIASMVHENLGVSIVPDLSVPPKGAPLVKRMSLGDGAPLRTLGLVHQDNPAKAPALDALFSALAQVIETAKRDR